MYDDYRFNKYLFLSDVLLYGNQSHVRFHLTGDLFTMLDQLLDLSLILAPFIALIPWMISIIVQSNKGRDVSTRRKVLAIWVSIAIIFTIVSYLYDPPNPIKRDWDYSGLNFYIFGILTNFAFLGLGGIFSMFLPCPPK